MIRVTSQLRTEHLTQLFQIQSFLSKERIFRNGTREEFETENGWTTSISDQNWSTHERLKGQLVKDNFNDSQWNRNNFSLKIKKKLEISALEMLLRIFQI